MKAWWSGEHEAYWKDGITRLAFLAEDSSFIKKSKKWIYEIIDNRDESGYIGVYADGPATDITVRFNHRAENGELWTQSRIFMAMLSYYEFTKDKVVLDAVEKATKLTISKYQIKNPFHSEGGGIAHGIGFFESLEALYRITSDSTYSNFAKKLYGYWNDGADTRFADDLILKHLLDDSHLWDDHGAHTAEGIFVPFWIAALNQDPTYQKAADAATRKLAFHSTPSEVLVCDEFVDHREGSPDEAYEYCYMAEVVNPMNKIISITGDISYADKLETMVFNAAQGARLPILTALSYCTIDNRFTIDNVDNDGRYRYAVTHNNAACCVLNGGRLMPYYATSMWLETIDNSGVVAMLYGPSEFSTEINNIKVHINENTSYPFSDRIEFEISPESPVEFSLTLRKPHGVETFNLKKIDGAKITELEDRIVIENKWKAGDKVEITFNFEVQKHTQAESKTVSGNGMYLKRGALIYALPFSYTMKKTPMKDRDERFYQYVVTNNDTEWDYYCDSNTEFIFNTISNTNTLYPWDEPLVELNGTLVDSKGEKRT